MIKNMELAQVRRGESFILDGVKFVKLDEDAHASFVLTADVFPKHIPFEHKDAERKDHDNFVGSYLQKHVDIWRILDRRRAKSDEYGNPAAACRV
mgnify:CR=1 FL=1